MIEVTRLDGKPYYVNPHQIEHITENPDTTLVMMNGKRLVVATSLSDVLDRIVEYRSQVQRQFVHD